MAKGHEDTALYVYNKLISLNEVGGRPDRFGCSVKEFHSFNKKRQRQWPHSFNATSTHDTKRGEDVRARINVISEIPREWERNVRNWSRINKGKKSRIRDNYVPDKNDEYFLYQTLLGAFPFARDEYPEFVERIKQYIIKAVREAKVHTEWIKLIWPTSHVLALEQILDPSENVFLKNFFRFKEDRSL
jgi:(1->4)-alpha-D-glucan 1-alpha-D-glucosylmutase